MDHILSLLILLAFSIGAHVDQVPSSTRMSPDTGASATQPQPPSRELSDNDAEESRPSPLDKSGSNNSELFNVGDSAGHLPPPSAATAINNDGNIIHPRLSSPVSPRDDNSSEDRSRLQNGMLLHSSVGDEGLRPLQSSDSNASQLSNSFNPNSYNLQSRGDTFDGVQRISFKNANIYEVHGNQSVNYSINTGSVLKDLAKYAMLDATFDSSARDPPPRCHPGTRLNILQAIQEILRDPNKKAQLDWLYGAAGVGKSAVIQTIAEAEVENNALGASLFFSRPHQRDDPRKVFATIAYQLAVKEPFYQHYLAQQIAADPSLLEKAMDRQFYDLIIAPFAQNRLLGDFRGRVILLDGLDECKGNPEQCRIIELIYGFVSRYPSIPFRWVIASRPEEHLRIAFSGARGHLGTSFWEKEIPIDSERSVLDVELYLNAEFAKIRKRYPDLTVAYDKWPSETQFLTISRAASGLFVFASTVIRFINNDENPVYRLNLVISFLEKRLKQYSQINPLLLLDALYERILSEVSFDALDNMKLILGYLIIFPLIEEKTVYGKDFFGRGVNLTPFWICNVLGLEQHVVYGALRKLRSVLAFPVPEHAYEEKVRFLHASFPDYIKDHERSHIYSVNLDKTITYVFCRYMTILQQYAECGSYDIDYSWSVENLIKISQRKPRVFKSNLVSKAGTVWAVLLQEHHNNNPKNTIRLSLPLADVMKQIKQLDYSYSHAMFDPKEVISFIRYLEEEVPVYLREDLIQDVPLASLDKARFLKSVYARRWILGHYGYTDPFGGTALVHSRAFEELGKCLEKLERALRDVRAEVDSVLRLLQSADASETKVTIVGIKPSKCRVLVQDTNCTYSFPYIA